MSTETAERPTAQELAALFTGPRRIPAPAPGIYFDVPMADYLAWQAASASALGDILRSPAHARARQEPQDEAGSDDTVATVVGKAGHTAILEPEKFADQFVEGPAGSWTLKANKDAVAALRAKFPNATVLKPKYINAVNRARDAVRSHPAAGALLSRASHVEVSIVWDDPETGVRCKARPDFLVREWGTIGDLKSAFDAGRREFAKAIARFGYHRKAAFYLDGMNTVAALDVPVYGIPSLNVEWTDFAFIAFEKEPPYATAVYQLEPGVIQLGRDVNRGLLKIWAECERNQYWPAYPTDITYIGVPDWARLEAEGL